MEIAVTAGAADADVTAFAVLDPAGDLPDLDPRLAALVASGEIRGTAGATCVLHRDDGSRLVAAGAGPARPARRRRDPRRGRGRGPSRVRGQPRLAARRLAEPDRGRAGPGRGRGHCARRLRPGTVEDGEVRAEAGRTPDARRRRRSGAPAGAARGARCAMDEPGPRPGEPPSERPHSGAARRAGRRDRAGLGRALLRGSRLRRDLRARNGRVRSGRAGKPQPAAPDRAPVRPTGRAQRPRPRSRRQGDHVRHRGHLDQAGPVHGGHEGRHGRRRSGDRGHWARSPTSGCPSAWSRWSPRPRTWSAEAPTAPATS